MSTATARPGPSTARQRERGAERRRRGGGWLRTALGVLGELMMTAGVLCLLFVVWQLWWTDVESNQQQSSTLRTLEQQFGPSGRGSTAGDGARQPQESEVRTGQRTIGKPFAIIRIPRFGSDYARPIFEGVGHDVLDEGVGHYTETVGPGEIGNFSLAGHRVTYGKPFNRIAELQPNDKIIIETATGYAVYAMRSSEIVLPSQSEVIAPVPDKPGEEPTERWLTMTACHPMFSARERFIVHAQLVATYPRAEGLPSADLQVGG